MYVKICGLWLYECGLWFEVTCGYNRGKREWMRMGRGGGGRPDDWEVGGVKVGLGWGWGKDS